MAHLLTRFVPAVRFPTPQQGLAAAPLAQAATHTATITRHMQHGKYPTNTTWKVPCKHGPPSKDPQHQDAAALGSLACPYPKTDTVTRLLCGSSATNSSLLSASAWLTDGTVSCRAPQSDWLRLRPSLVGAGLSSRSCGEGEGLWVWRMGREGGEQRGV